MRYVPHQYQVMAKEHILNNPKCGLFLDMGLGKTVTTLTAIDELLHDSFEIEKGKILVIAPLRVAEDTWSSEVAKWDHLKHLKISKVLGSAKQRQKALASKADIYIINRDNVVWLTEYLKKDWSFKTIIIDELSSFKNPSSKRFKSLKRISPYFDRVIGLTGTPAPRSLLDLWPQLYLLDRGKRLGGTFTWYKSRYFTPGKHRGYVVYEWRLREGSEDEIQKSISDICISLQAKDWLTLPKLINVTHSVSLPKNIYQDYIKFEREKIIEFEAGEVVASNEGVLAGKLMQFSNGAIYNDDKSYRLIHDTKLDELEDLVEAANSNPVLIFYNFKHDEARIFERLKNYEPRTIKSSKDIEDWNSGDIQVLVCHPASMGHGLNLQQGGHIIIWFGLTWDLEIYQQANARLYRQGQTKSVLIHHIVCKDTIDEDVMDRLHSKATNQKRLIDAVKARMEGIEE